MKTWLWGKAGLTEVSFIFLDLCLLMFLCFVSCLMSSKRFLWFNFSSFSQLKSWQELPTLSFLEVELLYIFILLGVFLLIILGEVLGGNYN